MRHQLAVCLAILLAAGAAPVEGAAQAVSDSAPGAGAPDSTPKKKGGLWGKAKKIAGNKVVQQVAKTAACTMVPGGQAIAGAIDAASADNAGAAAQGAASAATGSSCMPGMTPNPAAAGPSGLGDPSAYAAYGAGAGPAGVGSAGDPAAFAKMQQMMAAQMMGAMPSATGGTEAPGRQPVLADDVAAELAKGKTAVRDIDWTVMGPTVSAAGAPGLEAAMASVANAMRQVGGKFRLDLYMDKRYQDAAVKTYGPGRLEQVHSLLVAAAPGVTLQIGKAKRDGDPRLEIVRK